MATRAKKKNTESIVDFKSAPLIPIRNVVIFPNIVQPLTVGRIKSINAIEAALKKDRFIVVSTQKSEFVEDPKPEELFDVGVGAEIIQVIRLPDSTLRVIIEGFSRVKIKDFQAVRDYYEVEIEPISSSYSNTHFMQALKKELIDSYDQYYQMNKRLSPENYIDLINIKDLDRITDMISSALIISVEEKQKILGEIDLKNRIRQLIEILKREISILDLQSKIDNDVKSKFDKTQKEYFLREQLKAIQKELGETESEYSDEVKKYRDKMGKLNLPEEAKKAVEEELNRLMKMPPMMAEAGVVRNYIEWVLSLPWNSESEDQLVLANAKTSLDEDHYGLKDVKERILEYLAVKKLSQQIKAPILCLVGPPGVGKTSLGKSVAKAMNRKFVRMSLGGIRDEAEIRGHRRTYIGALPGRIIQGMKQAGTKNPVFLLDEIDKIGTDFRGDPSSALLEALDPEQNASFSDHFLEVPFDLSKVFFITTANVVHTIPPALRDRMEIINLSGYTEPEKKHIAEDFLIPKQLAANGLNKKDVLIKEEALDKIISEYTREAGLRSLERQIAKIFRKIALQKAMKEETFKKLTVKANDLIDYLRLPSFRHEEKGKVLDSGIVTGLSVTEFGGEILFIESNKMVGKGNLILTGQLGDVMKESATAAMSYIRSRSEYFNFPLNFNESLDIHIHVPEGAIPKDGPSAGVTIFTSLMSLLKQKKVSGNIAMTGEITIKGRILPIGGLKDKLLAAKRAGITTIYIPKENEKELFDIAKDITKDLTIIAVEHLDELYHYIFER
ncbi:MAG: endopeptidase La [Caldisericia bacterium]|nr:endopeptidase La [Caldisericia bacterium]